jgi:tetratricopeptide (TPR) repeat protein
MKGYSVTVLSFFLLVLCLLAVSFEFAPQLRTWAIGEYENTAYFFNPSPARAFSYGERHFDASDPADYDINRAEYFFELAAAKDPTLPYLYHELARISFLRGNFTLALSQINFQISLHGDSEPASYYVRGLIEGYMGDYNDAANDYTHFLQFEPHNWAAKNDDAWVLLKAERYQDALAITQSGLVDTPDNPWLLNSEATALFELGKYDQALAADSLAAAWAQQVTPQDWTTAYPGNDPSIAPEGIASFQAAIAENIHSIKAALASSTVQSK